LKHNRISTYNQATIGNTLKALSSLFLLLVRYSDEEFSKAVFRMDFVKTGYVPEYFHGERERIPGFFWYDSKLFGTGGIAGNIVSDDINQINTALASSKFQKFIGRFKPYFDSLKYG
jgi:hypothetical protein